MPKVQKPSGKKSTTGTKKGKTAAKKKQGKTDDRPVLYPEYTTELCVGENALTAERMRQIMGWEVETEGDQFGAEYFTRDGNGKKVRAHNNVTNRSLVESNALSLMQEILRKRWNFNGEPIIIGKTGLVLNGQHTGKALIVAKQLWEKEPDKYPEWESEPTIDKLIVYGVDESDAVVNTMDTCKPRSLSDVIYRSEYFAEMNATKRKKVSKITEFAVRSLWHRTGVHVTSALKRTHSECLDFIDRHPRVLECAKHIFELDGNDNRIKKYLVPGNSAGLLYLMGSSATDPTQYRLDPHEDHIDWGNWEKACDFFSQLVKGDKELRAVLEAIAELTMDGVGSHAERTAILVKAWHCYRLGDRPKPSDLSLDYHVNGDGFRYLAECPDTGGIDVGNPNDMRESDPSPEEIARRAAAVRENPKRQKKSENGSLEMGLNDGDKVWVDDPKGEPWYGVLVMTVGRKARVKVAPGFAGAGTEYDVPLDQLTDKQPIRSME